MNSSTNIVPISMKMNNVFIVKQEGTILVDSGNPGSEDVILEKLREIGISPEEVRLIILTHGHADHAGSAAALREKTGAKVVVHRLDADKLRKGLQGDLHPLRFVGRVLKLLFERDKFSRYPSLEPDILIDDSFDLNEYGIRGKVISTPGHTMGSVSVVLDSGDAIVGDLIFPSIISSGPNLPFWADDPNEAKKSIQKLMKYSPERIYITHGGGPYSIADLKEKFHAASEN